MIDALAPAVAAITQLSEEGADMKEVMESAHEAARQGMEATKQMPGKIGRARYQKEKGVGHIDAGSASVAIFFETLEVSR